MALPATDVFTGTTGTQLTTYSGNWSLVLGNFDIQSNGLCCDKAGWEYCIARWNADVPTDDQYSQGVMAYLDADWNYIGVAVRCSASAVTAYGLQACGAGDSVLFKHVAGTTTQLSSTGGAGATNDVFRLEAEGTTITPKKNGSVIAAIGAVTDSAIASGYVGVQGWQYEYGSRTGARLDNWEGGNLGAVPTFQPRAAAAIDSMFVY